MSDRQFFGKHWLRIEPDGVIFLKYFGALTLVEMQQVVALSTAAVQRGGDIYMLFDVNEAGSIEAGARKLGIQWLIDIKVAGAVNFGGSLISRTAAEMIAAAARFMHKIEVPLAFFKTEAESRAWIAEQRQRRAHKS
jgi:hypothetical protein